MITIENGYGKYDFKVMGVIDESLGKTVVNGNFFMTMNSGGMGEYTATTDAWAGNNYTASFVKLRPDASPADLEKKLPAFLNKYGGEQMKSDGHDQTIAPATPSFRPYHE